jgi:uncharacterized protein (TIGR00290 family)
MRGIEGTIGKPRAAISWSGGKDSALALMRARARFDIVLMLTMFDERGERSRSHGQRPGIFRAQAERLGLDLVQGRGSWETYDRGFSDMLREARTRGVSHVIFGDILYREHHDWAERLSSDAGLVAVEPLFGEATHALFREFVGLPGRAVIVTARQGALDESWLGRELSASLLPELARLGVDPCGENGEYHTIVLDCPAFRAPLDVRPGRVASIGGCWTVQMEGM